VLEFPHELLRETVTERPRLVGAVRTGGRTASGVVTASRADGGGLWAYGLQAIVINKSYLVRWFEMFLTLMAEGARPIIVPICNHNYAPLPDEPGTGHIDVPHSPDDTPFSDDALYHQHYVVDAFINPPAPLRATTIYMNVLHSGPFLGGELFSIEHLTMGWRFYRVVGITPVSPTTPNYYAVQIEPPLREAINAGVAADFNKPRCVMQLAAPSSLELQMRRFGRPTLQFIESFMPLA
jgi:hypothetical protein